MTCSSTLVELRRAAREIFDSALQCVDAREAVQRVVALEGPTLKILDQQFDTASREIYVVAIGKAAHSMAAGLLDVLGERVRGGVVTGPPTGRAGIASSSAWQVFEGGHPLPNAQSLAAANAAFDLLKHASASRAIVLFLISGGGSAMIEWPRNQGISLEDLRRANQALISCGAPINEINAVRQAFSAIKGGGLASLAPLTTQITLIISDVNPGEEANVASGPTILAAPNSVHPLDVLDRYRLRTSLPDSVLRTVDEFPRYFSSATAELDRPSFVLLDNQSALVAATEKAKSLGFKTEIAGEIVEQPIELGCRLLLASLNDLRKHGGDEPTCLISGGEFGCSVRGAGRGGRNQETVLRCVRELDRGIARGHTVVLSGGTDGIDGNSPAAGAIADQTTIARGRAASLDAQSFLAESDSFSFFSQLGETIITGPSGTNVRDLRILLATSQKGDAPG